MAELFLLKPKLITPHYPSKKLMRPYILLFLALFALTSCKENFNLKIPKIEDLQLKYREYNTTSDLIYGYLTTNYDSVSTKTKIKKSDWLNGEICSFEQIFEGGIEFSTESCDISEGIKMRVKLPKVSKRRIVSWIETINTAYYPESQNQWDFQKTKYHPNSDLVGCYYDLYDKKDHWSIIIICGG